MWTAIPRIGLIGLKIAQSLFLNCVIRYLSASTTDHAVGGALVGATVLIYLGTAVRFQPSSTDQSRETS